ncbi:MAG: efflux RND transporter periplasmic adaptor subunit [Peptococcaceae bacterium]
MGKKEILFIALIFTLLSIGTACSHKEQPVQADAKASSQVRPQVVAAVKLNEAALTNTLAVVGKIVPNEEVKVSPKTSGKITRVLAEVGQEVAAGTILMELDSSDLALQVEKNRIQLDEAKRSLERKKVLLDSGAISQTDYEAALSSYETYSITLRQSENELANTQVKSPIAGIIAMKNVNPGETVTSSTVAFTVVNIGIVQVKASLMEDEVNYVKTGQEVEVAVPAVTDKLYQGTVVTISPYADDKDKTYPLSVAVVNTAQELKPGMFAELKLKYNRLEGVIAVPRETVVDRGEKKVVYLVDGDKAVECPVEVGIILNGMAEIRAGLKTGDVLITSGLQTMRDGKTVSIQGEGTVKNGN